MPGDRQKVCIPLLTLGFEKILVLSHNTCVVWPFLDLPREKASLAFYFEKLATVVLGIFSFVVNMISF